MANWAFSASTGRYTDRDTGRFLTNDRARSFLDDAISVADNRSDTLAGMVGGDPPLISPADWRLAMRQEIKQAYIKSYLEGRGGRDQMSQADWGSVGGMLGEQYRFLDDFTARIESGELSEAQIRANSQMYMESSREGYERANQRVQESLGMDEEIWVLGVADHCPDCVGFAALGWNKIEDDVFDGATPGSGDTVCLCIVSPESRVLTLRGWVPLLDVVVGEMVLTHRMRWRPVTSLIVKPSKPYHRAAQVIGPSGRPVWATDNHLWWTPDGWRSANDIYNRFLLMYNVPIEEAHYEKEQDLSGMRGRFTSDEQARALSVVSPGMCLRETQRSQGVEMQLVRRQGKSPSAMAGAERENPYWHTCRGQKSAQQAIRLGQDEMAAQARRQALELVLERGGRQEKYNLPLSVGVDYGERAYTRWPCDSPQERELLRRPARELGAYAAQCPSQTSRRANASEVKPYSLDLPQHQVRQDVQGVSQVTEWSTARPEILLAGMLPRGTAVYDLTVADDHSFIIEGLVAHNTNCHCHKSFRQAPERALTRLRRVIMRAIRPPQLIAVGARG